MKKIISAVLVFVLSFCSAAAYAEEDEPVKVVVDGVYVSFDVQPVIENGRTLVPIRAVAEQMGAYVSWDDATSTTTITYKGITLSLGEGNSQMIVAENGSSRTETLEVAPQNYNGRLLMPIRAIVEAFGAAVGYKAETKTVVIISGSAPSAVIIGR